MVSSNGLKLFAQILLQTRGIHLVIAVFPTFYYSHISSFVITRKLTNWDSEYLIGRIHGLLQSLNYKGRTSITFPLYHTRTVIKSSQTFGSTLRSAFVRNETYEVEVYWPYANQMPGEDSDGEQSRVTRKCLVRSENGWFRDWKPVLRAAVLGKRKGWVGMEDWIEVAMRPPVAEEAPTAWGDTAY
jgi:hypothetical protein